MPRRETTLVLLPGMDGTGSLFAAFVAAASAGLPTQVVGYPRHEHRGYVGLAELVTAQLPSGPFVLVAESYSGPLALRVAAEAPAGLRGVVLVASFVVPPLRFPRLLAREPVLGWLLGRTPPGWVVRALFLHARAPADQIEAVRAALRSVAGQVLARRLIEILSLDARNFLPACPVPILYLQAQSDRLVPRSALTAILRCRPDVEVETLPGPHLLLQSQPTRALRSICRFIKALPVG